MILPRELSWLTFWVQIVVSGFQLDEDDVEDASDINAIIGNYSVLCENYRRLATALDVVDAKTPEQVYKSRLGDTGSSDRVRRVHMSSAARMLQYVRERVRECGIR